MTASTDQPKTSEAPAAKPEPKDELKTLPLPEVEKKLGSSPDGISPQRTRGEENQSVLEIPYLFLGPHSVDDRSSRNPVGGGGALARFFHHSPFAGFQRRGRILGRAPGRQRHRSPEGQTRYQCQGETGRE